MSTDSMDSMEEQPKRRVSRVLVIVVLAIVVLVAVTVFLVTQQRGGPDAQPTAKASATEVLPVPAVEDLNGVEEKMEATVLEGCAAMSDDAGWVATGKVTNEGDEEQTFLVSVYFLEGDEPVNFAQSRVVVPAGETVPWVAPQEFSVQDSELTCKVIAVS